MGQQPELFHERIEDAISEVIASCGGRKKFAAEMWQSKSPRDAHNLLDACLNPERSEKFSLGDLLYIFRRGREVGCHSAMRYLADACGYSEPVPVSPEDEKARLQREFVEGVKTLSRISEALGLDHKLPAAMRVVR